MLEKRPRFCAHTGAVVLFCVFKEHGLEIFSETKSSFFLWSVSVYCDSTAGWKKTTQPIVSLLLILMWMYLFFSPDLSQLPYSGSPWVCSHWSLQAFVHLIPFLALKTRVLHLSWLNMQRWLVCAAGDHEGGGLRGAAKRTPPSVGLVISAIMERDCRTSQWKWNPLLGTECWNWLLFYWSYVLGRKRKVFCLGRTFPGGRFTNTCLSPNNESMLKGKIWQCRPDKYGSCQNEAVSEQMSDISEMCRHLQSSFAILSPCDKEGKHNAADRIKMEKIDFIEP